MSSAVLTPHVSSRHGGALEQQRPAGRLQDTRRLACLNLEWHGVQRLCRGSKLISNRHRSLLVNSALPEKWGSTGSPFDKKPSAQQEARASLTHSATVTESEISGTPPSETRGTPQVTEERKGPSQQFIWEAQWYPISILEDLDKVVPTGVTILGLPLVVWWDRAAQAYQVFQDLCPHRLAPLSEGRIHESGALQCSYHGWTFRGNGGCTGIPQAPKDGPPVNTSPRACARVYPSRVHQGMLWFWAQHGPEALLRAEAHPPPTIPMQSDPQFHVNMGQCDLNYGYELLVENLSDPAHVPFAHHKIMGNRKQATPLDFSVSEIGLQGIAGGGDRFRDWHFYPPTLVHSLLVFPPKGGDKKKPTGPQGSEASGAHHLVSGQPTSKERQLSMSFYCVPRSPGKCRVIFAFSFNFLPPIAKIIPRWYSHLSQMMVLDSDHYFLHLLEKRLQEDEQGKSKGALAAYYAPTKSDAYVLAYRKWLDEFALSGVQWARGTDPRMPEFHSKREIMDRQENHVKICKTCKGASAGFETLRTVLQAVSFAILALTAAAAAVRSPTLPAPVAMAAVALSAALALASLWLNRFIQRTYFFQDYIHALVD